MSIPFRKDDQATIMSTLGPMVPVLMREAVDEGFHAHTVSRSLDPAGWADYGACSRANMLYDRIATSARELVGLAAQSVPELSSHFHANRRSTEVMLDPYFAFRIKRTKSNRKNLTTGVATRRNRIIRSDTILPVGQMILDLPETSIPADNRVWLTVGFDLDELEERITRVGIGVETRKRWLWRVPLAEGESEIVASFPVIVADRINEMRERRQA